ncbi:hypothetical protein JHU04_004637, partial [Brenneria sp. 4F2]|nr:hypothetical protein [Brenneria bubanii]
EESDFQANSSAQGHVGGTRPVAALKGQDARLDVSSDSEFLQDISDHAELYALLFGEKGADSRTTDRRKHRTSQRYTAKSAP